MEENTESITFVDVSESESKIKSEDVEQSSLQEKVDLENLVLLPSESQERTEEEHLRNLLSLEPEELFKKYENFIIKDEPSENEINNDTSEKVNDHKYEKSPIELPTNVKEQKFRDLFCLQCSLQFDGKSVYDLHLSLVHGIKDESKSEDSEVKIEIDSEISETINDSQTSTLPPVHKEIKQDIKTENLNPTRTSAAKMSDWSTSIIESQSQVHTYLLIYAQQKNHFRNEYKF